MTTGALTFTVLWAFALLIVLVKAVVDASWRRSGSYFHDTCYRDLAEMDQDRRRNWPDDAR